MTWMRLAGGRQAVSSDALWLMLAGLAIALSGCVHERVRIEPALLNDPGYSIPQKLAGKVLVLTDAEDDQKISSIAPQNRGFGSATRMDVPLGRIVGESATAAFRELFADGADWLNPPTAFSSYAAVVRPKLVSFSYRYEDTWANPVAVMETTVSVSVLDNAGNIIWQQSYPSGPFKGELLDPNSTGAEDRGPAIQQKIHELMVRAALDFADTQFQQAAPLRRKSHGTR